MAGQLDKRRRNVGNRNGCGFHFTIIAKAVRHTQGHPFIFRKGASSGDDAGASGGPGRSSLRIRELPYTRQKKQDGSSNFIVGNVLTVVATWLFSGCSRIERESRISKHSATAERPSEYGQSEDWRKVPKVLNPPSGFSFYGKRTSREDRDCVGSLFGAARGQKTPRRCEGKRTALNGAANPRGEVGLRQAGQSEHSSGVPRSVQCSGFPFLPTAFFSQRWGNLRRGFFLILRFPFTVGLGAVLVLSSCDSPKTGKDPRNFGPRVKGRCTGADPCLVCSTCNFCKRCAKNGGSCGVCS